MKQLFTFTNTAPGKILFCGLLTFLLAFVFSICTSYGQATNATISGIVTDDTGETLIGASVLLKNESTGFEAGGATSSDGRFNFQQLPLGGPYVVRVTYIGFAPQVFSGYFLNLGDRVNLDVTMESSSNDLEEVIVSGESFKSQIENLGATTAINARQIKNLPTEGRNFTNLTALSPLQGGGSLNLGGQRRTSTNVTLDGVNARNQLTAGEIGKWPQTPMM
jgi:hypothetical protein